MRPTWDIQSATDFWQTLSKIAADVLEVLAGIAVNHGPLSLPSSTSHESSATSGEASICGYG